MPPGQKGRKTATVKIPEYMTFRPTLDQMQNFSKYVEYMESQGAHLAGVAKIVPPPEWVPRKAGYSNMDEFNFTITNPLKQIFNQVGSRTSYQTKSIMMQPMLLKDYEKLCNSKQYKTPPHTDYDDLEDQYWKAMGASNGDPPIYGCDVHESLTDVDQKAFNIRNLNTILDEVGVSYKQHIRGVTSPYLYFGMWKTTFSWHVEDMDLHSINYLHFGMPKTWYVIPPQYGHLMERATKELFPNLASWCSSFMRHKTCLINPKTMNLLGIPYQKVVQEERNAIIVFPYAYHSGFNHGFNCAESTNFALPRWIEYGKRARQCDCGRSKVIFSMEAFVKKYQPEMYEAWKNGTDIAPHPEDPPEVRAEFELRARDPEAYAKLKREQLLKLNEKARKARLVAPTLEDDGLEIEEEDKGLSVEDTDCATTVLDVYQHHEASNVKVAIDPNSMEIVGNGKEILEDYLDVDDPEVKRLIAQGILIKIGEKTVNVKVSNEVDMLYSKYITKTVHGYQHIDMDLEAIVDPESFELVGNQMPDLIDFLGEDTNLKDLINAGVFCFSYDAEKECPNPNYRPATKDGSAKNNKRPSDETLTNESKKLKGDPNNLRFGIAIVYKHLGLDEMITVMADTNKVIGRVSEMMKRTLVKYSLYELVRNNVLVKVGQKVMSFEESEDDFKNRLNLKYRLLNMNLKGIEFNRSHLKLEMVSNVVLNKVAFILPTKNLKKDTCRKIRDVIETEDTKTLFSQNYLNLTSEKSKLFNSNEQTAFIDRIIGTLKNNCSIKKCDIHCDNISKLTSHTSMDNNNCSCRIVGVFKLKRLFLRDEPKANMNSIIITVDEYNNSVVIEDLIRDQTYIIKEGRPPSHIELNTFEAEDVDSPNNDGLFLHTKETNGSGSKKDKTTTKIDLAQDAAQKVSSITKFPKEIDDIRAPYDSEQEFESDEQEEAKQKDEASLALAYSMVASSEKSDDSTDEESDDDPDYGKKGNNSDVWKTPKKKKKGKSKTPKKMDRGDIQAINQIQSSIYAEFSQNSNNVTHTDPSKSPSKKKETKPKPRPCLLKTTIAILEYFEMDDLNRIFNCSILAKTLNKNNFEVLAALRVFRGFNIVRLIPSDKIEQRYEWIGINQTSFNKTLKTILTQNTKETPDEGLGKFQTWRICMDLLKILMRSGKVRLFNFSISNRCE